MTDQGREIVPFQASLPAVRRGLELIEAIHRERDAVKASAHAFYVQGNDLYDRGQYEDAITEFDELVRRFGDVAGPEVRVWVAKGLLAKAAALWELQRRDEIIAACVMVDTLFGRDPEPEMREQVAEALAGIADVLSGSLYYPVINDQWEPEEALVAYDDVVKRYGDDPEPGVRVWAVKCQYWKGGMLVILGRTDEAIAAHTESVRRFGDDSWSGVRTTVAMALEDRALALEQLDRLKDSISTCDELVDRFGNDTDCLLTVRSALLHKASLLRKLNRPQEAIAQCDEVIRHARSSGSVGYSAEALCTKGAILGELQLPHQAIAAYDEVLRHSTKQICVAKALVGKGIELGRLKRPQEAIACYDEVIERFGEAAHETFREQVAMARRLKGHGAVRNVEN